MKKNIKALLSCALVGAIAFANVHNFNLDKASAYIWGHTCWRTDTTPPGSAVYPFASTSRYIGRYYVSRDCLHVNGIQGLLNKANSMDSSMADRITVDGIIGYYSDQSIKKFQRYRNLTADGIIGQLTYQSLVYETRSKRYTVDTYNGNVCIYDWSGNSYNPM